MSKIFILHHNNDNNTNDGEKLVKQIIAQKTIK